MQTVVKFNVEDYPRLTPNRISLMWWGVVGLILVELSVLGGFIATFLYLLMMNPPWPPAGVEAPPLLFPSISVVLLLLSCVTMWLAGRAMRKDQQTSFVIYIFLSVALVCWVLVLRWKQFEAFSFRWDEHVYGSLMWTLSGFHFTHLVSAVLGTVVVGILGMMGFFNSRRQIAVVVDTLYWNFVALAWIPLYVVMYWLPRWLN